MAGGDKKLTPPTEGEVLQFPCPFPIKVIGTTQTDLQAIVFDIVRRHADDVKLDHVRCRLSTKGNYQSVSVTVTAVSRAQMDAIYLRLSKHEAVLMAL